jgi:hypothetical protein
MSRPGTHCTSISIRLVGPTGPRRRATWTRSCSGGTRRSGYELGFWAISLAEERAGDYERCIGRQRIPLPGELPCGRRFYSADYLRAWIRTAQLRAYLRGSIGEDWWRRPETGELLRALFAEGTRPTSEEIADRIGYDPLDTAPLVGELVAHGG